jgi:hypothetical protein
MEKLNDQSTYKARIVLLEDFLVKLRLWCAPAGRDQDLLKSFLNRNLIAVQQAVIDAGTFHPITLSPPAAIGGVVARNIDPFTMIFQDWYGTDPQIDLVADMVEQAIGVYESLEKSDGLVRIRQREAIDIEAAIERALRPTFFSSPPSSEREVQNAVETILNALGIVFVREKEAAPVGPRAFHPDFTVRDIELAIEVKLASPTHNASAIQEEIAADISAYRTKWRHLLFIIYDNGVITDPYQMRRANMQHFGISVVIVKH